MFAVIQSGGKQYKVSQGTVLKLEKLENKVGEKFEINKVLLLYKDDKTNIGSPLVKNAKVIAEVISQGRNKKVNIIKFLRRKHSMKHQGHRQYYTEVKITEISL